MKNKVSGFTLIELMIVIAIIAIIMSYALPAYRDYHVRTKISEGSAMAASYKLAVNTAFTEIGTLNGLNNDSNGIGSAITPGYCVETMVVVNGEITVSFDCAAGTANVADLEVAAATLVWTPSMAANGGLQWDCTATVNRPDQDPC